MSDRVWIVHAGYVLRAMRWQAMVGGAALGAALVGFSHLLSDGPLASVHVGVGFATAGIVIGAAFVFDDAAAATLAPVPVTLGRRSLVRLLIAGLVAALALVGIAIVAWERLAYAELGGQTAGIATVAVAGAALAGRRAGWRRPGVFGAAAVTALLVADTISLLPGDVVLLSGGLSVEHTAATAAVWVAITVTGVTLTAWAIRDPAVDALAGCRPRRVVSHLAAPGGDQLPRCSTRRTGDRRRGVS